jgi:hypothetical protein
MASRRSWPETKEVEGEAKRARLLEDKAGRVAGGVAGTSWAGKIAKVPIQAREMIDATTRYLMCRSFGP